MLQTPRVIETDFFHRHIFDYRSGLGSPSSSPHNCSGAQGFQCRRDGERSDLYPRTRIRLPPNCLRSPSPQSLLAPNPPLSSSSRSWQSSAPSRSGRSISISRRPSPSPSARSRASPPFAPCREASGCLAAKRSGSFRRGSSNHPERKLRGNAPLHERPDPH